MNVAILGTEQASQSVAQIIEGGYNPWLRSKLAEPLNVAAYVANGGDNSMLDDKAVLNLTQFAALYRKGLIDKIIFPRELCIGQVPTLSKLRELGVEVEDIYLTCRLSNVISLPNFVEPYVQAKYLPYLEFHIADHCNLNCKACEHYSGLVKEPHFPNLKKFTRDFERLHEFIDDIGKIRILGGEPLLNPEVNECISN